jgi:hypothetical protein
MKVVLSAVAAKELKEGLGDNPTVQPGRPDIDTLAIETDDLSAEETSSLESAAAPLASNHAHPMPTRPENGTQASS